MVCELVLCTVHSKKPSLADCASAKEAASFSPTSNVESLIRSLCSTMRSEPSAWT
jgi:hypothetical protein